MTLARTPSQTVGPFYAIGLCRRAEHELAPGGITLTGLLLDGEGEPVTDGMVELWDPVTRRWGRSGTHPSGRFTFVVEKPPKTAQRAPCLFVHVFARGLLEHRSTRMYFPDEPTANAADPVLSSLPEADRPLLVAEQDDGALRFDIRLQGDRETVFFTA